MSPEDFYEPEEYVFEYPEDLDFEAYNELREKACEYPEDLNFATNDNSWLGLLLLLGALGTTPQPINPFLSDPPEPFNLENSELKNFDLEHKEDIYDELREKACNYPWDSYEERKVACDIVNDFVIDTVQVPDRAPFNYETAVKHQEFHYGEWLIISYAVSEEEAKEMHKRQVEYFKEHPDVTMIYEVCDRIWYSRDIDMGEHN